MKYIAILFLFSIPSWACVDLSGTYIDPVQEHTGQIDLRVVKQNDCSYMAFHKAFYDKGADFYHEDLNPTVYRPDGKRYCTAFGFCQSATVNETAMYVVHDLAEFSKADGKICVSENVLFSRDRNKSLVVTRGCNDGTSIKAVLKIRSN